MENKSHKVNSVIDTRVPKGTTSDPKDPRVPVVYDCEVPKGEVPEIEFPLKEIPNKGAYSEYCRICDSYLQDSQCGCCDSCENTWGNCICGETKTPEVVQWVYEEIDHYIEIDWSDCALNTYREIECPICKSNTTHTQCDCCRRCRNIFEECTCDFY